MRVLKKVLFVAVMTLAPMLYGGAASAAPVSVNGGQLQVRARVLPRHTIVVDEQGVISKIFSNTTEDVAEPRAYRLSVEAAQEQVLTPELYDAYRRLVPPGQSRIGVLYDRQPLTDLLRVPSVSLVPGPVSPLFALR